MRENQRNLCETCYMRTRMRHEMETKNLFDFVYLCWHCHCYRLHHLGHASSAILWNCESERTCNKIVILTSHVLTKRYKRIKVEDGCGRKKRRRYAVVSFRNCVRISNAEIMKKVKIKKKKRFFCTWCSMPTAEMFLAKMKAFVVASKTDQTIWFNLKKFN